MSELTKEELAFLEEMHNLYFEDEFNAWVEHMEETYPC